MNLTKHYSTQLVILMSSLGVAANVGKGQVVQLPSVQTFSYSGAAWVPDAGTAALAGNSLSRVGSVQSGWGPYGPRASGGTYGTSSLSATVQILDLQAMDDAILSTGVPKAGSPAQSATPPGRSIVGGYVSEGVGPTIDPGKWQRVLGGGQPSIPVHSQLAEADIRFYLRMGQEAEAANRVMAARVYYRMAIEAMTPEMHVRYERIMTERAEAEKAQAAPPRTQVGSGSRTSSNVKIGTALSILTAIRPQ